MLNGTKLKTLKSTKMRISIYTIFSLIVIFINDEIHSQYQHCFQCSENPCDSFQYKSCCADSNYNSQILSEIISIRERKIDFNNTLRMIHEPATISMWSNLHHNYSGYQKKPFLLDGDLNIPISFQIPNRLGFGTLQVIPRFKFRIFQNDPKVPFGKGDISLPVRTPSAMPGLVYYFTTNKLWKNTNDPGLFSDIYFGLYAFHHSNGQDGEEVDLINKGEVNTYNGNFSENLNFEFILGGRKKITTLNLNNFCNNRTYKRSIHKRVGKELDLKPSIRREFYWKLGYEWHPKELSNQIFTDFNMYGRKRLNLYFSYSIIPTLWQFISDGLQWCQISSETSFERFRHNLKITYIMDQQYFRGNTHSLEKISQFNVSKRVNINYSLYWIFKKSQFSALFAQIGYFGSDEYNIYFNDSYLNLKAGIAFGFFNQPDKQ